MPGRGKAARETVPSLSSPPPCTRGPFMLGNCASAPMRCTSACACVFGAEFFPLQVGLSIYVSGYGLVKHR